MFNIVPLSTVYNKQLEAHINNKTKPRDSLGQLERLAIQLGRIYCQKSAGWLTRLTVSQPHLIVFAGDHGIAQEGVSIAPSEVTQQMVINFANGGAAINVFTRQFGWHLEVVDAGILSAISHEPTIINQRLGSGTKPIHVAPAMSMTQVTKGFEMATALVAKKVEDGCNLIAFGEMGIGNTSSASAIMAVILAQTAKQTVGRGTGVDDEVLNKKTELVQQAVDRFHSYHLASDSATWPLQLLAHLGGFEIVQICGAMLAAAELQVPIVVDGFICSSAAMVAKLINANVTDYLVFSHCSGEQAHQQMLAWFDVVPLLDLGLRLGEGTGAALSLPLVQATCAFYNDMASFEQANIDSVTAV